MPPERTRLQYTSTTSLGPTSMGRVGEQDCLINYVACTFRMPIVIYLCRNKGKGKKVLNASCKGNDTLILNITKHSIILRK